MPCEIKSLLFHIFNVTLDSNPSVYPSSGSPIYSLFYPHPTLYLNPFFFCEIVVIFPTCYYLPYLSQAYYHSRTLLQLAVQPPRLLRGGLRQFIYIGPQYVICSLLSVTPTVAPQMKLFFNKEGPMHISCSRQHARAINHVAISFLIGYIARCITDFYPCKLIVSCAGVMFPKWACFSPTLNSKHPLIERAAVFINSIFILQSTFLSIVSHCDPYLLTLHISYSGPALFVFYNPPFQVAVSFHPHIPLLKYLVCALQLLHSLACYFGNYDYLVVFTHLLKSYIYLLFYSLLIRI